MDVFTCRSTTAALASFIYGTNARNSKESDKGRWRAQASGGKYYLLPNASDQAIAMAASSAMSEAKAS